MLEAVMLVGGKGTRLRPLTMSAPKPMLPVAGVPVTEHQIARARQAGVTRVVLGTSYRAEVFSEYFGSGEDFGIELEYVVEDEPLGTGGAIRNVTSKLESGPDDPVIIFNGDVLTGLNISALVEAWRAADADVALYLTTVEDPRAFGLVPTDANGQVTAFLEKPTTPAEIVTDQINAGCYVFRRSVIDRIPPGEVVSVERDTFPELLRSGAKVIGVVDDGYWLDLGTPLAFVQGSNDLVRGIAPSPAVPGPMGEQLLLADAEVDSTATVTGGTVVGRHARVGSNTLLDGVVVFDDATIGSNCTVTRSVIGVAARVDDGVTLADVVVADGAHIETGVELRAGARVFPQATISAGSIRFSSDKS